MKHKVHVTTDNFKGDIEVGYDANRFIVKSGCVSCSNPDLDRVMTHLENILALDSKQKKKLKKAFKTAKREYNKTLRILNEKVL